MGPATVSMVVLVALIDKASFFIKRGFVAQLANGTWSHLFRKLW